MHAPLPAPPLSDPAAHLAMRGDRVPAFLHDIRWSDLPGPVQAMARTCLMDLLGVAAAGRRTALSAAIHDHAVAQFGAGHGAPAAPILFDGRPASPAGAALAGGMTIDSVDAHDGWRPAKGHAGCGLVPSVLGIAQAEGLEDGSELLARLVIGYEIACRAGTALHATVPDYHTSGAWVAVACAGLGARALGLSVAETREALGIAEYHGPRSQMMRCIDHPTMLKDGSGWGAMAGTSAAYLARAGFTGAPAITVEADEAAAHWADLGTRWLILEQYFKPLPVCRWAQPAVFAALGLAQAHRLDPDRIATVEVGAFAEAVRLATIAPRTTEEAQYSLPFPLAAALVRGRVGPEEVTGAALTDPAILSMAARVRMSRAPEADAVFPARRLSSVTIVLDDGRRLDSGPVEAPGDPERPLGDAALVDKFHAYADPVLGAGRATRLRETIGALPGLAVADLTALLGPVGAIGH